MLPYKLSELSLRVESFGLADTDLCNAQRLVGLFRQDIRYCPLLKRWLIWNGSRWEWDDTGQFYSYAKLLIRALHMWAARIDNEKIRTSLSSWAYASENRTRIKAMIELASKDSDIVILPEQLDADPMLLGVKNGVVDLRTNQLLEAKRGQFLTKACPVEFNAESDCPRFELFINRITNGDTELAAYLQKMVGYFLTGLTKEQTLFLLYGKGENGKSVFLGVVQRMLGDYACTTPPYTFMVRQNPGGPSPDLARLRNVRLTLAFEPDEGAVLAESVVKQITGQDRIACRHLYAELFEFDPQFKVAMMTNHKPIVRGVDHAIWRRIRLIPFTAKIKAEEKDRELADKLRGELPGILNWALKGLRQYLDHGLEPPECVVTATAEYRSEMDIIGDWIDECCDEGPETRVPMKIAYASYNAWCKDNGHLPFSRKRFGQRLRDRGIGDSRTGRERFYVGITLRNKPNPDVMGQIVHGTFGA